jgi:hypothetical protein
MRTTLKALQSVFLKGLARITSQVGERTRRLQGSEVRSRQQPLPSVRLAG